VFERLRAAVNQALEAATPRPNLRDLTGQMRHAVVELKVSVAEMRQALAVTEEQLAVERRTLEDALRRGRLAAEIHDQGTVTVAERFAARHAERVGVLESKVAAQRAELTLAERELEEMTAQFRTMERERPTASGAAGAWRDLEAAGGVRPETDLADDLLKGQLERASREAAAEQQLRELKKRMGK
jgi:hypothetical protein